jgi:hypothetical protein
LGKRKGIAIGLVVVIVFVVVLIFGAVAAYFRSNMAETSLQKSQIKAYYLCMTGIELGTAALRQNKTITMTQEEQDVSQYNVYKTSVNAFDRYGKEAYVPPSAYFGIDEVFTDTLTVTKDKFGVDGDVDIKVSAYNDPDGQVMVRLDSDGHYEESGKVYNHSGSVVFNARNPAEYVRDVDPANP